VRLFAPFDQSVTPGNLCILNGGADSINASLQRRWLLKL